MKKILMNTPMTKAISEERKRQFRELTYQPIRSINDGRIRVGHGLIVHGTVEHFIKKISKYQKNDVLNVVEQYEMCMSDSSEDELFQKDTNIFLKITNVEIKELQDISDEDILEEGIVNTTIHKSFAEEDNREDYICLWNSTAPKGYQWIDNPYVFVYEFERKANYE